MNPRLPALLAALALTPARAVPIDPVVQVLQASARDWSRGDLAAFMGCYENAPTTQFVTPDGLISGYDNLRAHYAKAYGTGASMGQLSLDVLDERVLDQDYTLVTGRFRLARKQGPAGGIFTLLMHRTQQGWRIAYDHTS